MINRWPRSLHSQVEAVFHSIRSIRESKETTRLGIRSFGAWKTYRYETHRFVNFMIAKGRTTILDTMLVAKDMADYLSERLANYVKNKRSRQTMETILSALSKFEYATNHYIDIHLPTQPKLDTEQLRMDFYSQSKRSLKKSSKVFDNRAYPDPIGLIEAIADGTYQLQASLQYEGGLRAEGVGAPSNRRLKNPLTEKGLRGIVSDPVNGSPVGVVASVEKGGKETEHYVSLETYQRLKEYIALHGKLESDYNAYVEEINQAARKTSQYAPGRGSHGLKHNFAQERYMECVQHGMTHEQALQQTSLETSHFRLRETLGYTRG
jgi:integrase